MFERHEEARVELKQVQHDVKSEKADMADDLRDVSKKLERRLDAVSEQIEDANFGAKKSLKELRTRLTKQKKNVDNSLREIEGSTSEQWEQVKVKSDQILTEAKIEVLKIEEKAENLIK